VDLVGIEPSTSSMPWKKHSSRRLILNELATGRLVKNRYIGRYFRPTSGQIFNLQNSRAAWAGVHADRFEVLKEAIHHDERTLLGHTLETESSDPA
jgi:hypothetical protein